jgi:hypothetical protein
MRRFLPVPLEQPSSDDSQSLSLLEPSVFGLAKPRLIPSASQLRREAALLEELARRAESERRAQEALTALAIARETGQVQHQIQTRELRVALQRRLLEAERQEHAMQAERRRLEREEQIAGLATSLGISREKIQEILDRETARVRVEEPGFFFDDLPAAEGR